MFEVRRAVHIRTGQPAAAEAIDAWLSDHEAAVTPCADVYEACVHLLRAYEQVPEMVVIGTDWLAPDELAIVRYARETWPRAVVILYGAAAEPVPDASPLTLACRSDAALRELLADTPAQVLERSCARAAALPLDVPLPGPASPPTAARATALPALRPSPTGRGSGLQRGPHPARPGSPGPDSPPPDCDRPAGGAALTLTAAEPPRSILSAEELSALLDASDRG